MPRYTTRKPERACGWVEHDYKIEDGKPLVPCCDVDTSSPADTGLIMPTGEPIMRLPNPVGFGRDKEW